MKDTHLTLRLPAQLAKRLARWARDRGLPKSHVVREAVAKYLAPGGEEPARMTAREFARRWRELPRLSPVEAAEFGSDIARARETLPPIRDQWA